MCAKVRGGGVNDDEGNNCSISNNKQFTAIHIINVYLNTTI